MRAVEREREDFWPHVTKCRRLFNIVLYPFIVKKDKWYIDDW